MYEGWYVGGLGTEVALALVLGIAALVGPRLLRFEPGDVPWRFKLLASLPLFWSALFWSLWARAFVAAGERPRPPVGLVLGPEGEPVYDGGSIDPQTFALHFEAVHVLGEALVLLVVPVCLLHGALLLARGRGRVSWIAVLVLGLAGILFVRALDALGAYDWFLD